MAFNEQLVREAIEKTSDMCSKPFVRNIEEHYAGYFDELGLTINLHESATEVEWHALAGDILTYLNKRLPEGNPEFSWTLSFWQNIRQVGLFYAGDTIDSNFAPSL